MPNLDKPTAELALILVSPMVLAMFQQDTRHAKDLHIDVGLKVPHGKRTNYVPLARRSFGQIPKWEHRYSVITNTAAILTAEYGISFHAAKFHGRPNTTATPAFVEMYTELLLLSRNVSSWGSWTSDNIVVAVAGALEHRFGEAIATSLLAVTSALCKPTAVHILPSWLPSDAPMCMTCGVWMQTAGSIFACPSCGRTSGSSGEPEDEHFA